MVRCGIATKVHYSRHTRESNMAAVMPAPAASRLLLSGNEAVARAVWESGCKVAAAYPGTPSTEILETLAEYPAEDLPKSPL